MTEKEIILQNISLAFVNGHISQDQAQQATDGLQEHWNAEPEEPIKPKRIRHAPPPTAYRKASADWPARRASIIARYGQKRETK